MRAASTPHARALIDDQGREGSGDLGDVGMMNDKTRYGSSQGTIEVVVLLLQQTTKGLCI